MTDLQLWRRFAGEVGMWIDDLLLERCHEAQVVHIWIPQTPLVVLGSSNRAEVEVDTIACSGDQVEVLKRYGGGGTVVLHPGCVVISIGAWVRHPYQNKTYFDLFNRAVIHALACSWPELKSLEQRGLSDITYGTRKVAGTSLFRSRNYALYQASLLVECGLALIEKYLKHPSKEPDYRHGRTHADFLIGLNQIAAGLTTPTVASHLELYLPKALTFLGADELIEPKADQFQHLLQRATGAFQ